MTKNIEVVKSFLMEDCEQSNHLTSTGNKLFSYDTVIAEWHKTIPNAILLNMCYYSNTTSHHQHMVRRQAVSWGITVLVIKEGIERNTKSLQK